MVSALDKAKRALVSIMKRVAVKHGSVIDVHRESENKEVTSAYRKLSRVVHPDRHGGSGKDQKTLNAAYTSWQQLLRRAAERRGKSHSDHQAPHVAGAAVVPAQATLTRHSGPQRGEYRIQTSAVLLTYQGCKGSSVWARFLRFIEENLVAWKVRYWCATLEKNTDGGLHLHLMLQFTSQRDCTVSGFRFEKLRPNAAANDMMGDGFCRKKLQQSIDRGMFYCWANKIGTVRLACGDLCVAGNYAPAWTHEKNRYQVLGAWPEKLWKCYKLDSDQYEEYLHQCRDGIPSRKRNFEAHQGWAEKRAQQQAVQERTKRIRNNPELYTPFRRVLEAERWLGLFKRDALRYPILMVHAPSYSGKTEWAESLFNNPLKLLIGTMTHFPERARELDRSRHDGLVLDDVRDLQFISDHQEKLQGKYSGLVSLADTPSGQYAFCKDMYKLPVVVTVNDSTKNLQFLRDHDFLSSQDNVRVLSFRGRPGEAPPIEGLDPAHPAMRQQ